MSVVAITPDYSGEMKDRVENFHGQQLLGIGWEHHLSYGPLCIPVSPDLPFGVLAGEIIPSLYPAHPDTARIDWSRVEWLRSGKVFTPDPAKSLKDNGLGHKAMLRFRTPGLDGFNGSCN
jgi:phenol hydroxylase P4 protein